MQHFSIYVCNISFLFIISFDVPAVPSDFLSLCQSVRPPDGLIQAAGGVHGRGGVAVAAISLYALGLAVQARIHQAVCACGARGPRTGQEASGGALAASVARGHHGELVGAGARAVIQVGVGLEVLRLVVGVGRRQVGVVSGRGRHAEAADAGAGGVGGVGEGSGVMHARVGEARVGQRRQRREGAPLLEEVCSSWWSRTKCCVFVKNSMGDSGLSHVL